VIRLLYLQRSHYDALHKLSEAPTVLEGAFGTMEEVVLEEARERAQNSNGFNKNVVSNRSDYGRKGKFPLNFLI
jgi:predicted Rossmann-fold nucleotide-binding protein